jgi:hypothetical protein
MESLGVSNYPESAYTVMNRIAREQYGTDYKDLEPYQKKQVEADPQVAQTQAQQPSTDPGWRRYDETDQRRLQEEEAAVALYRRTDDGKAFREQVSDIQANAAIERAQVDRDFKLFQDSGNLPSDMGKRALVQYYDVFDSARLPGGQVNWEVVDEEMARLEGSWTRSQKAYVDRNTGLTEHVPLVQQLYDDKETLRPYWDIADDLLTEEARKDPYLRQFRGYSDLQRMAERDEDAAYYLRLIDRVKDKERRYYRDEHPEADAILVKWYGRKPLYGEEEPEAPRTRLPLPAGVR